MNLSFKEQLNQLLNCDLKTTFPTARGMNRKLYFFVGPTNSGKTYSAMQELIKADCGIYLAPLRLLALENYEFLQENKINSSLITGEEEIFNEDSTHICSTIEMVNFEMETDVCIIDEVQMLEDDDRGWAWVNAILGAPASKIIMTGSVNALESIKKIAEYLGEELEIIKFKRKNPLQVLEHPIPFREITKGTALIAFSRKDVLNMKAKLSKFFKVSVLYGNLSPEVRKEEAKRFREGKTDILIATDAIAMGLNLPIKIILFTTDTKFDGVSQRKLTPNEVIQISGRAGRYGHHEVGYVGATSKSVLNHIDEMFHSPLRTIKPPFKVKATLEQIMAFASHLNTKDLTKILYFFSKNMKFTGPFIATNIFNMIELAYLLDKRETLKLEDKYLLAQAPTNTKSPLLKDAYFFYVNAIINKKPCDYRLSINIKNLAKSELDLLKAEDEVKKISLYLWLSYKLPDIFYDIEKAYKYRILVNKYCEDSLKLNLKDQQIKKDDFRKGKDSFRDDKKRAFSKNKDDKQGVKSKSFRDDKKQETKQNSIKKHKIKKKEDYA
ncbi:MAG: helicase-related protein [Arcobacteraceae bacterium]|nr:helicase-related protein [Arcobacteraceae bacterium]